MANPFCSVNGIMNAVEFDVATSGSGWREPYLGDGTQVEFTIQNGYLVYFSDRRGMIGNPHPGWVALRMASTASKMSSTPPQRPALRWSVGAV